MKSLFAGIPAWTLALVAMLVVQLGAALSVPVFDVVGAAGTAWLRLTAGALLALAIARPSVRSLSRADVYAVIGLGASTGMVTVAFSMAIDRIPLGTAVAIEFMGPLTVAAVRSHTARALVWPALALAGVLILTRPWSGHVDLLGATYAVVAAIGWGLYIIYTHRVGSRLDGIDGLALMLPVAAVVASLVGVPQVAGHMSVAVLVKIIGLAFLMPLLPFGLEMQALRTMSHSAFGTLMAVEPAFGAIFGAAVLRQAPTLFQVVGITLVIIAGVASQRMAGPETHTIIENATV